MGTAMGERDIPLHLSNADVSPSDVSPSDISSYFLSD